jgi:chemotaxis signal transduction protein
MIPAVPGLQSMAADLRRAFNQAFADPPRPAIPETEDLLAIRIAGDPYALRVSELSGLVSNRKVVPFPSTRTELIGLAGIRATLVPIYGLSALLGYGSPAPSTRWVALCGGADPVGLAFEELEGFLRVLRADLFATEAFDSSKHHLSEIVRIGSGTRRIVDTRSSIRAIEVGAGEPGSTKER